MSSPFFAHLRRELPAMLRVATPVILAQLTQTLLMFSDTLMLGQLSAGHLAAIGVACSIIFFFIVAVWMVLSAINPTVAHFLGAGDQASIRRIFPQTFWLGFFAAIPALLAVFLGRELVLPLVKLSELERQYAAEYLAVYSIGIIPVMLYFSLRYFLEGLSRTRANFVVSALAVPFDVFLNYVLIFGKFGMPALGVMGAAASTTFTNFLVFGGLLVHLLSHHELRPFTRGHGWVWPERRQIVDLLKIGIPVGVAVFAEVSAFTGLGLAMAWLGAVPMAAHQVVMSIVNISFMVPLGFSAAISSRSGQFLGAGDPRSARFAAWTGIVLGVGFMALAALVFYFFREPIVRIYTKDQEVVALATSLLFYGVLFQVFDGLQVTVNGALRGLKDTTVPMVICTICYWVGGVVPGLTMGFVLGWGPIGIWLALPPCLLLSSLCLTTRYVMQSRKTVQDWKKPVVEEEAYGLGCLD